MRLHRLILTNYRGITHREIEFPDRGVVVVSGANEIGKSSMIEALDLLLEAKDRSTKKEVKQVKPTHADVGAEITAEISTGPYRFIYHKRFHKRCETQLTVLAPRREELSGDEAHERVRALLDETVDLDLWRAQRVLQAAATAPVDLSGSDALSRALDVAAGEAVQLSGSEPLLIDRIDAEYLRYFTPTGRPTGEWAAAVKRLHDADAEVARCAAAVAEVDEAVRRHAALTEDLARLAAEREQARHQLTVARTAAEAVAALTQQLKEAEVVAAAADATHAASVTALTERRRLRAEIDERAATIAELEAAAAEAAEEEATAREVQDEADAAADAARTAVETSQARVDAARRAVHLLADRDEADRLAGRLTKIDAAQRDLDRIERELSGIALTDTTMRAIEAAALAVERAAAQVQAASAQIELVAAADIELRVAGAPVVLDAGAGWSASATAPTEIEVPGLLTARVVPGLPASDMQAKLDVAQGVLAEALAAGGVDDVEGARQLDQRRRELIAARDRLTVTRDALTGDDTVDGLRARLAELRDGAPTEAGLWDTAVDTAAARAELDAAAAAHQQAVAHCETCRKVAAAAGKRLAEKSTAASVLREKVGAAHAELTVARQRLALQRESVSDDALAVKAEADGDAARSATTRVAELGGELARTAPDTVAKALDDAVRRADSLDSRHDEVAEALREVSTQLKVYGTEGRKGQLDAAESEREHAEAEYQRVHRRARAAQMLRSVMARHRDATRSRYVDPFRAELERLGRIVFGDSFEVDIDSELRICSRTLSGRTVPYDSLSGGAKEQLGIVARLAGAALVDAQDSVPVVIDDALGFTDADRLAKMGAVFDAVGDDGQVIVLTCSPQRYASVAGAHHIELTA
ncbi:AAA family ATPase [Mycobacterium hubeiense]|uniref:AAA family ATPase n=1 Tax=Mycobacterium hubeiense TaxID=1867256 RepID=UPI000C7EBDA1|nr:ATP-binding protein [Mycobacterium sp. QGD 101]